jgi:undecaprenyl diphosphate synthase
MLTHIALIMDGNRRWARANGLPAVAGHREGVNTVERVTQYCIDNHIRYLTLYAFSIENFKRSEEEKSCLFELIASGMQSYAQKFMEQGIRIYFLGDRTLFPVHVKESCDTIEQQTAHNDTIIVNILFCYGGQQEIVAAARSCMLQTLAGTLSPEQLTIERFAQELWTGNCPSPELIIRTGGARRLSNFLLYQCAYSELAFVDTFWPEFSNKELDAIVYDYKLIKRNFGS